MRAPRRKTIPKGTASPPRRAFRCCLHLTKCVTLGHMKTVSIRELHEKTGEWVRLAEAHEQIIITDRGRPVAALAPYRTPAKANRFSDRKILPAYRKLGGKLSGGTDSGIIVSKDRERAGG